MKIYLAGPMTGHPGLNFDHFHGCARRLREDGWEVINPAEINPNLDADWTGCMKEDIKQLVDCDGIHMLRGWETSKGASLEHYIAVALGLQVEYDNDF